MANAVETPSQNNLMTEGSIVKSLLLFALPLIFGNLLQQLYNMSLGPDRFSFPHP